MTFNKLVQILNLSRYEGYIELFRMIFFALLMTHFLACVFHYIGVTGFDGTEYSNWIDTRGLRNKNRYIRYLSSFYWSAVTTMTVGYGDIVPQNPTEMLFCTLSVLTGCGIFAYYINKIGIIL